MKLLPYDKYEIQTRLSLKEAQDIICDQIEPRNNWRGWSLSKRHKYFEGEMLNKEFKLNLIKEYRSNAFLPIIKGTFVENKSGVTTVKILMYSHPVMIAFMFVCAVLFVHFITIHKELSYFIIIPLGILLSIFIFWYIGFWCEAKKVKYLLTEIYQHKS